MDTAANTPARTRRDRPGEPATEIERELLQQIEDYQARTGTPVTRIGRDICGDPYLVRDMREGRSLTTVMIARIETYLDSEETAA